MSYKRDFQVKIDICYFLKKIFDFFKKFFWFFLKKCKFWGFYSHYPDEQSIARGGGKDESSFKKNI
jgi:hypothetical protein